MEILIFCKSITVKPETFFPKQKEIWVMGHYLSEMQADPVTLDRYQPWQVEMKDLQKKISEMSLSKVTAGDMLLIKRVLDQTTRPQDVGNMYNPTYDIPGGGEEALKIARELAKKYKLKKK